MENKKKNDAFVSIVLETLLDDNDPRSSLSTN